jgi:hypothetical protein
VRRHARAGVLVYVSYGEGRHVAQLFFSLLSALRFRSGRANGGPRIAVYTDQPETYRDLPVERYALSNDELRSWRGHLGFNHIIKLEAMRIALARYGQPCIFVDADTYFRRNPGRLLGRVSPGRSVLHIRECGLGEVDTPSQKDLARGVIAERFHDLAGRPITMERGFPLWNTGVIGVDPADSHLLAEAINLTPQIYERTQSHVSEQLAISYFLARDTRLRAASDTVYHYWHAYAGPHALPGESQWAGRLPQLLAETASLPPERRGKELIKHAYRAPFWGGGGRLESRMWPLLVAMQRREPRVQRST